MQTPDEVADIIIERFCTKGEAFSIERKQYKSPERLTNGVRFLRETGRLWIIYTAEIVAAVEAIRKNPLIYDGRLAELKPYIKRPVLSPMWAILHLLTLSEIMA